ncbi:MAG: DUF2268 domain-containing putative Zn-dependent protease [Bacteroidales bacterium]|nr:DUF2268 domain-containing putative Zn-dependent protease [Bacteroidales bacterium]
MKNKKILWISCLAVLLLTIVGILIWHFSSNANSDNTRKEDISESEIRKIEKNVDIHISRYEKDLFALDTNHLKQGLQRLSKKYPEMLIGDNVWNEPEMLLQLKAYLSDPVIVEIYKDALKTFPNLTPIETELNHALSLYLNYFPNESLPKFYSLVPGINTEMPSVYGYDNDIFIHLDMYLGKDYKYYSQVGMPLFISERCDKKFLPRDCIYKALSYKNMAQKMPITLLDNMIFEGKRLYFTEMMFPEMSGQDVVGYNDAKFKWAMENQANVWMYIIEKDLLFSKQNEIIRQFIEETPFTKAFGNDSPGRIGTFIGWKIVQQYMEKHPETSLAELMQITDAQLILNQSGYKPINK